MTNIDHSLNDYLLWLSALRGQATEATPIHVAREASLMQQLVEEYRDAHYRPMDESSRLETNWSIIRERLQLAEAKRARAAARNISANSTARAYSTFLGQIRKAGSTFGALHLGTKTLVVTALLVVLAVLWSQWQVTQSSNKSPATVGEPHLRGDENTQRIVQENPADFANRVVGTLQSHNITARRVDLVDVQGKPTGAIHLQAKVMQDSLSIPALQALGVTVPTTGRLDLVLVPKP